jgi:probable HAF family extracellular repeat protein
LARTSDFGDPLNSGGPWTTAARAAELIWKSNTKETSSEEKTMNRKWLFVALCALVLTQGRSLAQDRNVAYAITDLGTLGGSSSDAFGINSRGQVVGRSFISSDLEEHAFLSEDGVMTDLGTLPGLSSWARAINNHGQVAGHSSMGNGPPFHAVLWETSGEIVQLGTLPGGFAAFAAALNDRGQVVGGSRTANSDFHAFLWGQGKGMTDLGTVSSDDHFSVARGINNRRQIAGNSGPVVADPQVPPQRGFIWERGVMTDLGNLGSEFTVVFGMNNRGHVVGESDLANGERHAFVWKDGLMTDLGTLGGHFSTASSINDHGQVVGRSNTASGEDHAFLWHRGVMTDLNSQISNDSGWILIQARSINRAGEIVGVGTINGQTHAFLLIPEDEEE